MRGACWRYLEAASGIWGADRLFKGYTGSKISKKSVKIFKCSKKKSIDFFFFFFLEESCRVPQARVTCYAASAQRRRREAQARSTGAQRRRAAPNVCSAAGAVPHLAPLQAVRSSWHERSEGHERSPVGVSSRWSVCQCVCSRMRTRTA